MKVSKDPRGRLESIAFEKDTIRVSRQSEWMPGDLALSHIWAHWHGRWDVYRLSLSEASGEVMFKAQADNVESEERFIVENAEKVLEILKFISERKLKGYVPDPT